MELMINQAIEILKGDVTGEFRVAGIGDKFVYLSIIKLLTSKKPIVKRGPKPKIPQSEDSDEGLTDSAKIICIRRKQILEMIDNNEIVDAEDKNRLSNRALYSLDKYEAWIKVNAAIMSDFLDSTKRMEYLAEDQGLGRAIREASEVHGHGIKWVYELYYRLAKYGFTRDSLVPQYSECGKPGQARPIKDGMRKPGKKPREYRHAVMHKLELPPQYGVTPEWKEKILRGWSRLKNAKISFQDAYERLLKEEFNHDVKSRLQGTLYPEIPTEPQVRYCVENNVDAIERIKNKTTPHNFEMNHRGKLGTSFEGRHMPGHTYAIDSTKLDIFLLNSARNAVIGRPYLYLLVDVSSGAIVGFYLTFHGQNFDSVKVALFNTFYNRRKFAELLGVDEYLHSLDFQPGIPLYLLTDRGEYLSKAALHMCNLIHMSHDIVRAYRGDLKGIVEVLFHHIKADNYFIPGAHLSHREEAELFKSKPEDARLTLHDYMKVIYNQIHQYNMTANVSWRMTPEMHAAGIKNNPAALWNWGFQSGNAYAATMSEDKLIQTFLPYKQAKATDTGLKVDGRKYANQDSEIDKRLATLSRPKRQDIDSWIHPGNIQRLWTNQSMEYGLRMVQHRLTDLSHLSEDEYNEYEYYRKLKEKLEDSEKTALKVIYTEKRDAIYADAIKQSNAALRGNAPTTKNMPVHREAEKDCSFPPSQSQTDIQNEFAKTGAAPINKPEQSKPKNSFESFLTKALGGNNG